MAHAPGSGKGARARSSLFGRAFVILELSAQTLDGAKGAEFGCTPRTGIRALPRATAPRRGGNVTIVTLARASRRCVGQRATPPRGSLAFGCRFELFAGQPKLVQLGVQRSAIDTEGSCGVEHSRARSRAHSRAVSGSGSRVLYNPSLDTAPFMLAGVLASMLLINTALLTATGSRARILVISCLRFETRLA